MRASIRTLSTAGVAVLAALALRCACAEIQPAPGGVDSRVREVEYRPAEVYKLRGHAGYQIDLQFEAGEPGKRPGHLLLSCYKYYHVVDAVKRPSVEAERALNEPFRIGSSPRA